MNTRRAATIPQNGVANPHSAKIPDTAEVPLVGLQPTQTRTKQTACQLVGIDKNQFLPACCVCKKEGSSHYFGNTYGVVCLDCLLASGDIED